LNRNAFLLLILIYLAFISLGLPDALLGSSWPSIYREMSLPLSYAGYLSMIIASGTVVSSALSGVLIRRAGVGPVTLASVFMTATALTGFSQSRSYLALCLSAVPLGLGAGAVDAALNNYVSLHYKARHMSWLHCFWGVGASAGPFIAAAYLADGGRWAAGYRVTGIIQFGMAALLAAALPLWNRAKEAQGGGAGASGAASGGAGAALFRVPGVKAALSSFFCYCGIEALCGVWGGSYLVAVRRIPPERAARWIAWYYAGITLGRFLSGFATLLVDGARMIRLGQALIASGILLFFMPVAPALPAAFCVIGLGCAPIYPSLLHRTPALFGQARAQALMGLQMAGAYAGATLIPPLFGQAAARGGLALFPFALAALLAVKILASETLNRRWSPVT
jgi:fucose permease